MIIIEDMPNFNLKVCNEIMNAGTIAEYPKYFIPI